MATGSSSIGDQAQYDVSKLVRSKPLPPRIHDKEREDRDALIKDMGEKAIWLKYCNKRPIK